MRQTGEAHKSGRVMGTGNYYASPVGGDGKVYLLSQRGTLSVVSAADQWQVIHSAEFGEEGYATPALLDGRIYLRTSGHLYCFGVAEAAGEIGARPRRKHRRNRLAADGFDQAAFGDDGLDEPGGGHVEGRIVDADAVGGGLAAEAVRDFFGGRAASMGIWSPVSSDRSNVLVGAAT